MWSISKRQRRPISKQEVTEFINLCKTHLILSAFWAVVASAKFNHSKIFAEPGFKARYNVLSSHLTA